MSNMKCPICGGEMIGNIGSPICHYNQDCPIHDRSIPQEIYDLLERTRKAVEIMKFALETISAIYNALILANRVSDINWDVVAENFAKRSDKALDEITALEQKESAFVHNKIEFPEYNDGLLEEFDKQFFENGQDDDLTETALEQKDTK